MADSYTIAALLDETAEHLVATAYDYRGTDDLIVRLRATASELRAEPGVGQASPDSTPSDSAPNPKKPSLRNGHPWPESAL